MYRLTGYYYMKSLLNFDAVKKALEQVVAQSDKNNGTNGMELVCHYWNQDTEWDEDRQRLQDEKTRLVFAGDPEGVIRVTKLMDELPKPKIIMEFKLLAPIPRLQGTKTISDGTKTWTISMENVQTIFIPEDSIRAELAEFEETGDMARDIIGNETPIIRLKILKGLLDVAQEKLDKRDGNKPLSQRRVRVPKRAYLTAVSYHSMQVVGRMKAQEEKAKERRYGMDEQE